MNINFLVVLGALTLLAACFLKNIDIYSDNRHLYIRMEVNKLAKQYQTISIVASRKNSSINQLHETEDDYEIQQEELMVSRVWKRKIK